jgi:hypothetical protein
VHLAHVTTPILAMRPTAPDSRRKPAVWGRRLGTSTGLEGRLCMPSIGYQHPETGEVLSSARNCRAICVVYVMPCTW